MAICNGARECGAQSNALNLILEVIFVPIFTYDDLMMSQNHPQHNTHEI